MEREWVVLREMDVGEDVENHIMSDLCNFPLHSEVAQDETE